MPIRLLYESSDHDLARIDRILKGEEDFPLVNEVYDGSKGEFPPFVKEMVDLPEACRNPQFMKNFIDPYLSCKHSAPESSTRQILTTLKRVYEGAKVPLLSKENTSNCSDDFIQSMLNRALDSTSGKEKVEIIEASLRDYMMNKTISSFAADNSCYIPEIQKSGTANLGVENMMDTFALNGLPLKGQTFYHVLTALNELLTRDKVKMMTPVRNLPEKNDDHGGLVNKQRWAACSTPQCYRIVEYDQKDFRLMLTCASGATKKGERSDSNRWFELLNTYVKVCIRVKEYIGEMFTTLFTPDSGLLLWGAEIGESRIKAAMNSPILKKHMTDTYKKAAKIKNPEDRRRFLKKTAYLNASADLTKYNEHLKRKTTNMFCATVAQRFRSRFLQNLVYVCCELSAKQTFDLAPITLYDDVARPFSTLLSNMDLDQFGSYFINEVGIDMLAIAYGRVRTIRNHFKSRYGIDIGDKLPSPDFMGMGIETKQHNAIQCLIVLVIDQVYPAPPSVAFMSSDDMLIIAAEEQLLRIIAGLRCMGCNISRPKTQICEAVCAQVIGIFIHGVKTLKYSRKAFTPMKPQYSSFSAKRYAMNMAALSVTKELGPIMGQIAFSFKNNYVRSSEHLVESTRPSQVMNMVSFYKLLGIDGKYSFTSMVPNSDILNGALSDSQNHYALTNDEDAYRREVGMVLPPDSMENFAVNEGFGRYETDVSSIGSGLNLRPPQTRKENKESGIGWMNGRKKSVLRQVIRGICPEMAYRIPKGTTLISTLRENEKYNPFYGKLADLIESGEVDFPTAERRAKRKVSHLNMLIERRREMAKTRAKRNRRVRRHTPF